MSEFDLSVAEQRDLPDLRIAERVLELVYGHPLVVDEVLPDALPNTPRLDVIAVDVDDREGPLQFNAWVADRWLNRTLRVSGTFEDPGCITVRSTDVIPPVGTDEFVLAARIVAASGRLERLLTPASLYRPMPPLVTTRDDTGTLRRLVNVGVHTPEARIVHRIWTVDPIAGVIVDDRRDVPRPGLNECEPTAPAPVSGGGVHDSSQVHVVVSGGGGVLWELDVRRPGSSSGLVGSGVELRNVRYRGRKVLHRAHVPMLNVKYLQPTGNCGPTYRDWQNEETLFEAVGHDPVAGYRVCTQPPRTILDSGTDQGNFNGVAFWMDGGRLRIVSEMAAGWYRYISEWWLDADGSIHPRFGFAATNNRCTCQGHAHNVYWRLDFDIDSPAPNTAEEFNDPPIFAGTNWHAKSYEIMRRRDPSRKRKWRVRQSDSEHGYEIVPGAHDGTYDQYGAGDVWFLNYRGTEIDDGVGFTTVEAQSRVRIDNWVDGESLIRKDIVVWYAGHFLHDHDTNPDAHGQLLGPDLMPIG